VSGVLDKNGVQWEHCSVCGGWVDLDKLHYAPHPKYPNYPKGVDLCDSCYKETQR
jgi:hypothetical protein